VRSFNFGGHTPKSPRIPMDLSESVVEEKRTTVNVIRNIIYIFAMINDDAYN